MCVQGMPHAAADPAIDPSPRLMVKYQLRSRRIADYNGSYRSDTWCNK